MPPMTPPLRPYPVGPLGVLGARRAGLLRLRRVLRRHARPTGRGLGAPAGPGGPRRGRPGCRAVAELAHPAHRPTAPPPRPPTTGRYRAPAARALGVLLLISLLLYLVLAPRCCTPWASPGSAWRRRRWRPVPGGIDAAGVGASSGSVRRPPRVRAVSGCSPGSGPDHGRMAANRDLPRWSEAVGARGRPRFTTWRRSSLAALIASCSARPPPCLSPARASVYYAGSTWPRCGCPHRPGAGGVARGDRGGALPRAGRAAAAHRSTDHRRRARRRLPGQHVCLPAGRRARAAAADRRAEAAAPDGPADGIVGGLGGGVPGGLAGGVAGGVVFGGLGSAVPMPAGRRTACPANPAWRWPAGTGRGQRGRPAATVGPARTAVSPDWRRRGQWRVACPR